MKRFKVADLTGIGHAYIEKLRENFGSVDTCEQLLSVPKDRLQKVLGNKLGEKVRCWFGML